MAFHSLFNCLGVVLALPFTNHFARLIVRLAPERGNPLTRRLDPRLTASPHAAVDAVAATVNELAGAILRRLADSLEGAAAPDADWAEQTGEAVRQAQNYLGFIAATPDEPQLYQRMQTAFHVLDHLRRLLARLRARDRIEALSRLDILRRSARRLAEAARTLAERPSGLDESALEQVHEVYRELKAQEKPLRRQAIASAAERELDSDAVIEQIDGVRGLRRIGFHVWRIARRLNGVGSQRP